MKDIEEKFFFRKCYVFKQIIDQILKNYDQAHMIEEIETENELEEF